MKIPFQPANQQASKKVFPSFNHLYEQDMTPYWSFLSPYTNVKKNTYSGIVSLLVCYRYRSTYKKAFCCNAGIAKKDSVSHRPTQLRKKERENKRKKCRKRSSHSIFVLKDGYRKE
jgi:hypothetical protein